MNLEAFQNLKRVLASVPAEKLDMGDWNRCAVGHACRDRWFREHGLEGHFPSAMSVFGVSYFSAQRVFTSRAGTTPEQVIATIDRLIAADRPTEERARHARRQVMIDQMLARAVKAEKQVRKVALALVAMFAL